MNIGWPQATLLFFMLIPLIMAVANDGKEKHEGLKTYNGPAAVLRFLGAIAILAWGGFFQ